MMLSTKHQKELASFRKKLGKHIFWFESLSEKNKLDVLFKYKQEKFLFKKFSKFPFNNRIHKYKQWFRSPLHKIRNSKLENILKN